VANLSLESLLSMGFLGGEGESQSVVVHRFGPPVSSSSLAMGLGLTELAVTNCQVIRVFWEGGQTVSVKWRNTRVKARKYHLPLFYSFTTAVLIIVIALSVNWTAFLCYWIKQLIMIKAAYFSFMTLSF